jgi:hypothetical protein
VVVDEPIVASPGEICLDLLDLEMGRAAKPHCDGDGQGKKKKRHEKISDHLGRPPLGAVVMGWQWVLKHGSSQ